MLANLFAITLAVWVLWTADGFRDFSTPRKWHSVSSWAYKDGFDTKAQCETAGKKIAVAIEKDLKKDGPFTLYRCRPAGVGANE